MSSRTRSLASDVVIRALWLPLTVFLLHVLFSACLGITKKLPGLDILSHFLGGIAIAFFFSVLADILRERGLISHLDRVVRQVLIFALTATAAVFWEFAEFVLDTYLGTHIQIDLQDTMSDIGFGILGGLAFICIVAAVRRGSGRGYDGA